MKVFVIFLVLIMISLTFFIPTSFAQSYVCQEHDSEITVISSKEVFYPNENMTLSVIGQPNKTTELIIENPKNTVFSETKTSTTDNTTFAYTIEANPMKGTWKIIANQDANVDILFLGVYDKPQRVLTVHATALSHSKFHTATFTIAGNPQQPLNLDVTDSMKQTVFHDKLILNSNGMCVYSLALSDFSTGVYDLEISDNTVSDSTTFSVGLQPYDPALEAVSKFTKHDASDLTKPTTPLKQVELGVSLDKIKCKSNLVLIQKYDGTPACVTESTKQKLIERGWTETDKSQIRKPVSVPTPTDPMSITINGSSTSLVIPINTGETKEIDILLEPKTPIVSSTVSVESYFGSAGDCNEIDITSYCPGRGIDMILSDTTITSQKEITLTIKVPANTTSGTYAYLIKTDTIVESLYPDQLGTIGKFIRFDLKVE